MELMADLNLHTNLVFKLFSCFIIVVDDVGPNCFDLSLGHSPGAGMVLLGLTRCSLGGFVPAPVSSVTVSVTDSVGDF